MKLEKPAMQAKSSTYLITGRGERPWQRRWTSSPSESWACLMRDQMHRLHSWSLYTNLGKFLRCTTRKNCRLILTSRRVHGSSVQVYGSNLTGLNLFNKRIIGLNPCTYKDFPVEITLEISCCQERFTLAFSFFSRYIYFSKA